MALAYYPIIGAKDKPATLHFIHIPLCCLEGLQTWKLEQISVPYVHNFTHHHCGVHIMWMVWMSKQHSLNSPLHSICGANLHGIINHYECEFHRHIPLMGLVNLLKKPDMRKTMECIYMYMYTHVSDSPCIHLPEYHIPDQCSTCFYLIDIMLTVLL